MTSHFFDLAVGESAYPSQGFPVTGSLVNGEAPIPKTYTVNASQNIALTLERPPRNVVSFSYHSNYSTTLQTIIFFYRKTNRLSN